MAAIYKRILLKISGEALSGSKGQGLDNETLQSIGAAINQLIALGIQVAVVVGGGNFWRGRTSEGMDRVTADHIGMLGTAMNALALSDALEQAGAVTRVLSAIEMRQFCEPYIRKRAVRHLEKGRVVIFACGTGNPFFSTDTAAALRASEIEAEIIFKATRVDGVYDKDPLAHKDAKKFDVISYLDVIDNNLRVMDVTAVSLCMENNTDILVFNLNQPGNIMKAVKGEGIGTLITNKV